MRALLLASGLAVAAVGSASAGTLNLAWDQCWPEGGVANKYFACDTSIGYHDIVASFIPAQDHPDFIGFSARLYVKSPAALPDWWQFFNPGTCRQQALTASADFRGFPANRCQDPWGGQAQGGLAAYLTTAFRPPPPLNVPALNEAVIRISYALSTPVVLAADTEAYAFRLRISDERTTGAGACSGCTQGVCLKLGVLTASDASGPVEQFCDAASNDVITWQCVTGSRAWQGPSSTSSPPCFNTYPAVCTAIPNCWVPAKNRTWGSIKTLYR